MIATLILLSVGIGSLLGVLRFVLDDKWNVLPKGLCRFCLFFWIAVMIQWIVSGVILYNDYPISNALLLYPLCVAVATVITSFSYVYIKNAN